MSTLYLGNAYLRKRAQNASKPMRSLITDDIDGARPKRTIRRGRRQQQNYQSLNYIPTSQAHFQHPQYYMKGQEGINRYGNVAGLTSKQVHAPNPQVGSRHNYIRKGNPRFGLTDKHAQQFHIKNQYEGGDPMPPELRQHPRQLTPGNRHPKDDTFQQQKEKQIQQMRNPMYADYDTFVPPRKQSPSYGRNQIDSIDLFKKQHEQKGSRQGQYGGSRQRYGSRGQYGSRQGQYGSRQRQRNQGNLPIDQRNSRQGLNNIPMQQSKIMDKPPRPQYINDSKQLQDPGQQFAGRPPQGRQSRQRSGQGNKPQPKTQVPSRKVYNGSGGAQVEDAYLRNESAFYGSPKPTKKQAQDPNFANNESRFYGQQSGKNAPKQQQANDLTKAEAAFYGVNDKPQRSRQQRSRRQQKQKPVRKLKIYNPISHQEYVDYSTHVKEITNKYDYDQQFLKNTDKFYNVERVAEKHKIRGKLQSLNPNPQFISENQCYGQVRRQYV